MIVMRPIGHVRGGRVEPTDDDWGTSRARIDLDANQFTPDALLGLDQFSHLEVVFHFDRLSEADISRGARHPRGRTDWPKVGVFAQRGRNRPNRIAISVCRIMSVAGLAVEVEGLDAIDGTPILDIKPVMRGFLPRGSVSEPEWANEIMRAYW